MLGQNRLFSLTLFLILCNFENKIKTRKSSKADFVRVEFGNVFDVNFFDQFRRQSSHPKENGFGKLASKTEGRSALFVVKTVPQRFRIEGKTFLRRKSVRLVESPRQVINFNFRPVSARPLWNIVFALKWRTNLYLF